MKKIICVLLALCLLIPVITKTTSCVKALSQDEGYNENHTHDFLSHYSMNVMHPHDGFFECECGKRLYADTILMEDCDICRNILCASELHYYTHNLEYGSDEALGECYCGKVLRVGATEYELNEHLRHKSQLDYEGFCIFCYLEAEYYTSYTYLMLLYATGYDEKNVGDFYGDYEDPNELSHTNGSHDWNHLTYIFEEHPHTCIIECTCSSRLYLNNYMLKGCAECHAILCDNGIHYYASNITPANQIAHVSCSYCDATISIDCTYGEYFWHKTHFETSLFSCPLCDLLTDFEEESFNFSLEQSGELIWEGDQYTEDVPKVEYKTFSSYTCPLTGEDHDFSTSLSLNGEHPHDGFFECDCGEKLYFSEMYFEDCAKCKRNLCKEGIHDYSYSLHGYSFETKYGQCKCGEKCDFNTLVNEYKALNLGHSEYIVPCASCAFKTLATNKQKEYDLANHIKLASTLYAEEDIDFVINQYEKAEGYTCWFGCEHENYLEVAPAPEPEKPVKQLNSFSSYVCGLTNDAHDFSGLRISYVAHPHPGYYDCGCGEKLFFNQCFHNDCTSCKEELCRLGIHDYSYLTHYTDFSTGYGECVCGATYDFAEAMPLYKTLGLSTEYEEYIVPCATCVFKALNTSNVLKHELNLNLHFLPSVYIEDNFDYAKQAYENTLTQLPQERCEHSNFLESKPEPEEEPPYVPVVPDVPDVPDVPVTPPPTSQNGNSGNSGNSGSSSSGSGSSSNNPVTLIPYYDSELETYSNMSTAKVPNKGYLDAITDVASQLFLGNYSEKVTLAGTIGEVIFSLTGLDAYKDVTDLVYNLTHWEFSWGHLLSTAANLIAIIPIVGALKSADEIALLSKLAKLDPDTLKLLDKIGGVNPNIFVKINKLTKADVLSLMTKFDGHALTKHVGNTSEAALKAIRKNSKAISSFFKQEDAVSAVRSALKDPNIMATIAYKLSLNDTTKFAVEFDTKKVIGVIMPANSDSIVNCTKVRVIIQKISDSEFYVKTAFPIK